MPRRLLPITALTALVLAGCGSGAVRHPQLSSVPLAPGTRVLSKVTRCNQGSNAYCAIEAVVIGPRYRNSLSLVLAERDELRRNGWIGASPYTGVEIADESPHHELRITYATATDDLQGYDVGWIIRPWQIISALDSSLFARTPAMSVLLEVGSR
jgi:hypothetical protein